MPFADFHVHGNFKSYFTGYTVAEKESPWTEVIFRIEKLSKRAKRILSSQSCFSLIHRGDVKLAVIPLYSTERAFPDSFLLKVVDFFSKNIDNKLFKDIRDNNVTNWQQLQDCYGHLLRAATDPVPGHEDVHFTRCVEDFLPGKMNIVLSMEGAHCFLDSNEDVTTPAGMDKITERLRQYKRRTVTDQSPRVFILNLTHLTRAPFSNHAFGMKLISHTDFIPLGRSLTPAGMRLIETALSYDKDHYPILIDVKHMSLESRLAFYKLRREKYPDVPITASHVGCTGLRIDEIPSYVEKINAPLFNKRKCNLVSYVKPRGLLQGTEFNPWSINLYEEDIVEIFLSGGIIGLSLDQRILGCGEIAREKMSKAETVNGVQIEYPIVAKDPDEEDPIGDAELHFRHFCNTIFYIVKVSGRIQGSSINAWERLVIGSDFDGLIDAVDFCLNGSEYVNIQTYMKDKLPTLAAEAGVELPADLDKLIADILYNNAENFLKKYYSAAAFPV